MLLIFILSIFYIIENIHTSKLESFKVIYKQPYYAVNLVSNNNVYLKPDVNAKVIYSLEKYRIFKVLSSLTLKSNSVVWVQASFDDVEGYVLLGGIGLFHTLNKTKDYLRGIKPKNLDILSMYKNASVQYFQSNKSQSIAILNRILDYNKDLSISHPDLFYHIKFLIISFYSNRLPKKAYQILSKVDYYNNQEINLFSGISFTELNFNTYIVKNIIKKNSFYTYQKIKLEWLIDLYYAYIYSKIGNANYSYDKYYKCLSKVSNTNVSNRIDKSIIFNIILDNLFKNTKFLSNPIYGMLKIENIVKDTTTYARYLIFRKAILYNTMYIKNNNNKKYLNLATKYYIKFINLYRDNSKLKNFKFYKGEIEHYNNSVDFLNKLKSLK